MVMRVLILTGGTAFGDLLECELSGYSFLERGTHLPSDEWGLD